MTLISKTQIKIKKLIRVGNNIFINIILTLFYFLIIGLAAVTYRLLKKNKKTTDSYWEELKDRKIDINYFQSSY